LALWSTQLSEMLQLGRIWEHDIAIRAVSVKGDDCASLYCSKYLVRATLNCMSWISTLQIH
jgi:hypothetical protein